MKRAKQECNQNAPVPLIPLYSLSNFNLFKIDNAEQLNVSTYNWEDWK